MKTPSAETLVKAQQFTLKAPKSKCRCGHTGDGASSEHASNLELGHGRCLVEGCDCGRFRWGGWTEDFERVLGG